VSVGGRVTTQTGDIKKFRVSPSTCPDTALVPVLKSPSVGAIHESSRCRDANGSLGAAWPETVNTRVSPNFNEAESRELRRRSIEPPIAAVARAPVAPPALVAPNAAVDVNDPVGPSGGDRARRVGRSRLAGRAAVERSAVGLNGSVARKDSDVFIGELASKINDVLASDDDAEKTSDGVPAGVCSGLGAGVDETVGLGVRAAVTDGDFESVLEGDGDRHLLCVGDCESDGVFVFDGDFERVPTGDVEIVGVCDRLLVHVGL
jgi:hypothetical protein